MNSANVKHPNMVSYRPGPAENVAQPPCRQRITKERLAVFTTHTLLSAAIVLPMIFSLPAEARPLTSCVSDRGHMQGPCHEPIDKAIYLNPKYKRK
jgi:hypothetical protein